MSGGRTGLDIATAAGGGGGGGAASLSDLYIDDAVSPQSVGQLTPNAADANLLGLDGYWQNPILLNNTAAISTPSDGEGAYVIYDPGSSNGQEAYIQGGLHNTTGPGCDFWCKFRFDDNDRSRLWLGFFANAATGLQLRAGNPVQEHAALRFQNGDVNFQFISKDATTQEITDTLVAPVNDTVYYFRVKCAPGSVEFTLYDESLSIIAGPDTHVANVPGVNIKMRATLYSNNDGVNSNRRLQVYSCHVIQDHAV